MNLEHKQKINKMTEEGESYVKIAQALGISENTVKSYCRRNLNKNIKDEALVISDSVETKDIYSICKHCEKSLIQAVKGQPKKFCSEKCRRLWWKANKSQANKKAWYTLECGMCGSSYNSYSNKNRKFCSHSCYIKKRFEKVGDTNDKRAV